MHWKDRRLFAAVVLIALASLLIAGCSTASATETATVQDVTPQEIAARLPQDVESGDLILVDVRTQQEWEDDGHIAGATLIPLDQLEAGAADQLPKDGEIVVYCRSGNRSAQAADYLVNHGYTNVEDLGGIQGWQAAGYDVVYGP